MPKHLPKVEPWKEQLIDSALKPKIVTEAAKDTDVSIDALMQKTLLGIDRALTCTLKDINQCAMGAVTPSREAIMNLKDCLSMLVSLKEREKEILDGLPDDELERISTIK